MSLYRHSLRLFNRIAIPKSTSNVLNTRNIKRWVAPTLFELKRRREKIGPDPPEPRSTFLEWNYEAEIYAFGKRLGEEFKRDILKQALTNRSYNLQKEIDGNDNENLIKEGEIILSNFIKSEYKKYYPMDIVESLHNYLTTDKMLGHIGKHMGLTDIILTAEFPVVENTIANTFKAVVAALEQSQNLQRAQLFIKDFVMSQMNGKDVYDIWCPENPIQYLTELLKQHGIQQFEPRLCRESATNTILANYQIGLYHDKKLLGIGWGESIQIAQETAALDAIQRLHENNSVPTKS